MGLRIASWNLGGAKHRGSNRYGTAAAQRLSWEALVDQGSDIVLAQEAIFAAVELPAGWRQSWEEAPQGWGSIIAVGPDVEFDAKWRPPSPVLAAYGSYLAFGRVRHSKSDWINVVSVHAPEDRLGWEAAGGEGPRPRRSIRPWSSDLILDALLPIPGPRIFGGDWNEARSYTQRGRAVGVNEFFERTVAAGLIDPVVETFGAEVRTAFLPDRPSAFQNDHLFVSPEIWQASARCWVVGHCHARRQLSDHAMTVLELCA